MTKSRYRGAYILALLIALTGSFNIWYNQKNLDRPWADTVSVAEEKMLDSLAGEIKKSLAGNEPAPGRKFNSKENRFTETKAPKPDFFDPNSISREAWLNMQLPEYVFNGLEKYRSKGGKFRKPADFLKMYSLKPELGQILMAYVRIDTTQFVKSRPDFPKKAFPEKPKYVPFNINEADTLQLMQVYGIGKGLANRIVRHRNQLGGFYSASHVYDVFGLDSSVVAELLRKGFVPTNPGIQKLKINLATEEELAHNPYIRKGLARILVKFRNQHGSFKKAEDLLEIKIIKPETVEKLKPYLEF
jgi:DNA uptake protein ComE-like DNA-binding protein